MHILLKIHINWLIYWICNFNQPLVMAHYISQRNSAHEIFSCKSFSLHYRMRGDTGEHTIRSKEEEDTHSTLYVFPYLFAFCSEGFARKIFLRRISLRNVMADFKQRKPNRITNDRIVCISCILLIHNSKWNEIYRIEYH